MLTYALSLALLCLALFWRNARRKQVTFDYTQVRMGVKCAYCNLVEHEGDYYALNCCVMCRAFNLHDDL